MEKTVEITDNGDTEKQKVITDKEIEEYKSGKVLYEEVLTGLLREANTAFRLNKQDEFCFAIQSIWNNIYQKDREEIYTAVKNIQCENEKAGYSSSVYDSGEKVLELELFNKLMTTNVGETEKISIRGGILSWWKYGNDWRKAYQIIQETLRKKYQGKTKKFTKDKLEEKV